MFLRKLFNPFNRGYFAGIINAMMLGALIYTDSVNFWTMFVWLVGSIVLTAISRNGWDD